MQDLSPYQLIIFDLDGTVRDWVSNEVLPGVVDFFTENHDQFKFAYATNQGGVGLRHWMEEADWGQPDKYPTQDDVLTEIQEFVDDLDEQVGVNLDWKPYICFAYQSKKSGKWSPTPEGSEHDYRWKPQYRKPSGLMLVKAMEDYEIDPDMTLMVGDSAEDEASAISAGVSFMYATRFFGN